VTSAEIGELVLQQLGEISEVAYVRFASVYRRFQGISDFVAALERLNRRGGAQGTAKVRLAVIS
jgi:transcriptional repressor NrdR